VSDLPSLSLKLDLNRLKALVDGDYITYYPSLTPICGGYKAAAMLSVALAWTRNWLNKHPEREGWFWKTRIEWQQETGLSRCEQENARKALTARGLLHESRRGMPARMHFRIDLDRLGQLLAQSVQVSLSDWDWDDPLLRRLLGRPVALYRRLAWAAGSLSGGLLLSHLVLAYRKDLSLNGPSEGWLRYYPQFIGRHCQLSRYEIDGARSRLTERGFLEARYTKTLPTNRVLRLRFDRLIAAIEACHDGVASVEPHDHNSLPHSAIQASDQPAIQASDQPAIQTGVYRHPESGQTGQLALAEPANRQVPNPPTSRPVLPDSPSAANPHSHRARSLSSRASEKPQEINPYPPPAPAPAQPTVSAANGGWRRSDGEPIEPEPAAPEQPLVFSGKLLPAEQAIARQWLADIDPHLRQLVLDEHSGMVRAREVWNPLGYLQTLIQSARTGRFTPTIAFRIAQSRQEALARAEAQRQAREIARHDHDPAVRLAAREHLARMRAQLGIRQEARG
jgi:hypothetical protein